MNDTQSAIMVDAATMSDTASNWDGMGRTCGVLAEQEHGRLGIKVALVQVGREESSKFVHLFQGPDLQAATLQQHFCMLDAHVDRSPNPPS